MNKVITISSLRGGVGKSSLSLELALFLSTKGKILLIDADFYSPNILQEINSRNESNIYKPSGYFVDLLISSINIEECIINVSKNLDIIFSNPNVNLWELSKSIGSRNFWIDDDTSKTSIAELGMARLKEYTKNNMYDFIIFDTMAGYEYPVVYLNFICNFPIFLSRPSIPQIKEILAFGKLLGSKERPINLIWSNVPNTNNFMNETLQQLENEIDKESLKFFKVIGMIPRDPKFEEISLLGKKSMIPGNNLFPYFREVKKIAEEFII